MGMTEYEIKDILLGILKSIPAGIPAVGAIYSASLSDLNSKGQEELLRYILKEQQKQSDLFLEHREIMTSIIRYLKKANEIEKGSEEILHKTYENTEQIKEELEKRSKTLLEKLEIGNFTKEDIIEGIFSSDINLKIRATYLAGEYYLRDTGKLLVRNLELPNKELIIMTLQALGQIRYVGAFYEVLEVLPYSDVEISSAAKYYFDILGSKSVNQNNFNYYLSWITGDDEELKEISLKCFSVLQSEGALDAKSITDELIYCLENETNQMIREDVVRILGEMEGITDKINFLDFFYNENENQFVQSAAARALFLDGKYDELHNYLNYLVETGIENQLHIQNIAQYCIHPDNPHADEAKNILTGYINRIKDVVWLDIENLERCCKSINKRIIPKKGSLKKNKTLKDCEKLKANLKLNEIINELMKPREYPPLVILYQEDSSISFESIVEYLSREYGFEIIDFREKDLIFFENQFKNIKNKQKIVLIYSLELKTELSNMIYWIYQKNEINIKSYSNSHAIPINEFRKIIFLMNLRNLEDMKENNPNRFDMLTSFPIYRIGE